MPPRNKKEAPSKNVTYCPHDLNEKQRTFCEEYLIDLNGTKAAIRAGYSEVSAYSEANRLLRKDEVRTYIKELMDKRSEITLIDSNFVLESLRDTAQRCMQATPVMVFDPVEKAMVQKKDEEDRNVWEFDSTGANRALELIGKHLGLFEKDNAQKQNNVEVTITGMRVV